MYPEGKTIVVTGAARSIGRAVAMEFARRGARVVLADINNSAQETTVSELKAEGLSAYAYQLDVSSDDQVAQFASSVMEKIGVPDLVFNNAARVESGGILDIEIEDIKKHMDVNVFGYIRVAKAFIPSMIKRGSGHIAIVSSPNGITPQPMVSKNMASYCLSKAADISLAQCLAVSLQPHDIGVSLLFPPLTHSEGAREMTGAAGNEFHRKLGEFLATFGVEPELIATELLDGLKEGKYFICGHAGYIDIIRAWAAGNMDPRTDWMASIQNSAYK